MTYPWDFPSRDDTTERERVRALIRHAFQQEAERRPGSVARGWGLPARGVLAAIQRYGTQLPGVSRDVVRAIQLQRVREELLEMDDIRALHTVRSDERFAPKAWIRSPEG